MVKPAKGHSPIVVDGKLKRLPKSARCSLKVGRLEICFLFQNRQIILSIFAIFLWLIAPKMVEWYLLPQPPLDHEAAPMERTKMEITQHD